MSYVEVNTKYTANIELRRGATPGTIVVEIDNGYVFLNSRGVKALRKYICQEIEKGWIK